MKASKKRPRKLSKHQLQKEQRERKSMAIWLSSVAVVFIICFSIYVWYSVTHQKEVFLPIGSGGVLILIAAWCVYDWWCHRGDLSDHGKK